MLNNISTLIRKDELKNSSLGLTEIEKIELKIADLSTSVSDLYQLVTKLVGVNEILVVNLSKKRTL